MKFKVHWKVWNEDEKTHDRFSKAMEGKDVGEVVGRILKEEKGAIIEKVKKCS